MTLAFLILSSLVLVALIQLVDKHVAGRSRPLVLSVLVVSALVPALVYHLTVMAMIQFAGFLLRQGWVDDQLATMLPRTREPAPDAVTVRQPCG